MKKIRVLILLLFLRSFSFADSLWETFLSFCTTWEKKDSLNFVVESGVPYDFCLSFSTTSQEPVWVSLGFVDGEYTNDAVRNKACSHQWTSFSPYVHFEDNFVVVSSWSLIQKTGHLLFPTWYSWEIHGCVVYTIPEEKKTSHQNWSLFDVIVRKANFMDGYVVGEFKRSIEFDDFSVAYYIDKQDKSLVVLLPFNNSGVLPEFLQFNWTLSNVLGYERSVTSSKIIDYWTSSLIEFRFADIPFYKGVYNFFFQWNSVLDTRLDLSYVPEKYKQKIDFSYDKKIVIVPWTLIFWILWFFVALFVLRWIMKVVLRR